MKKLVVFGFLLGLIAVGPAVFAAEAFAADKAPFKIGVMAPVTGSWASEGQDMVNIVKLLAEEVNNSGGAGGRQIIIEVGDDGGDPRTAALAAQRLISAGVTAVVGTYGSAVTEAAQDIYADDGVLQIATGSTSIRLTEKNLPLFFRTCPRDDEQGRVLADHVQRLGFKTAALVHDNSSYAKGLAEEVKAILDQAGLQIPFYDAITPGDRDYTATLTKIKTVNPDIIIFTGYYPEAGMLLRQKKEMAWDVPLIGGDATNNLALTDIAGKEAAAGFYFISPPGPGDLTDEMSLNFLAEYRRRFNTLPSSVWSIMAGDAFKVLARAAADLEEPTAENIAAYLHGDLKDFVGFTGPIAFDQKGDREGDVYRLYQVDQNGVFILAP
ncbi:MAG: branched-chain amino acid ABC transporter substrate-binding protein [Candidatus Adiutrix sp.]|jgi:branched-chain amino acid transport system substrate-binding protein|nr:branched-chain amino acid ABC transporter substrate-binding protein [Candidatus Adiutrix sp.]